MPIKGGTKIKVNSFSKKLSTINSKIGEVIGFSKYKKKYIYAVYFKDIEECWVVPEKEMTVL